MNAHFREVAMRHNHAVMVDFAIQQIISGNFHPMMTSAEELADSKSLLRYAIYNATPSLEKASEQFSFAANYEGGSYQDKWLQWLVMFHTARYNGLSAINARVTIPNDLEAADPYFTLIESSLMKVARKAQSESLKQLFKLVKVIVGHFTDVFGKAFWETTSWEQRRSIFGACFDSHPIWVMKYYRPKEFAAVDFGAIWAKETPDQYRWRRFYRNQFIDMADSTYTHRITTPNDEGLLAVTLLWKDWPRQENALAWQMGHNSYELPGLVGGPGHRYEEDRAFHDERFYVEFPEEGVGNFRTPSH